MCSVPVAMPRCILPSWSARQNTQTPHFPHGSTSPFPPPPPPIHPVDPPYFFVCDHHLTGSPEIKAKNSPMGIIDAGRFLSDPDIANKTANSPEAMKAW